MAGEQHHETVEDFIGSVWCFKLSDGTTLAPVLQLLRNGVIGGHIHTLHKRWVVRGGHILFLDIDGVTTSLFKATEIVDGVPVAFKGHLRSNPMFEMTLTRIPMPTLNSTTAGEHRDWVSFIRALDRPKRDHLVVLPANDKSLHTQWPADIGDDDRNWDLCITRYDQDPPSPDTACEYLAHQPGRPKYAALYNLFYPGSPLWDYQYIWLPDDDLMVNWRGINRMFETCSRHQLLLAQPSLVAESNINHFITKQDPQFSLRFTKFVEIMCPLFSQDALKACWPTFRMTVSAYGLDHVWPRLLGGVSTKVAIIDSVAVAHTRPLGKNYDVRGAIAEGLQMQELYAAPANYTVVGCMLQNEVEFS